MSGVRRKKTTKALYQAIRSDYAALSKEDDKYGVRKYSDAYIFEVLAEKYFRSPKTIENIVYHRI